jgi:hypothetical protein
MRSSAANHCGEKEHDEFLTLETWRRLWTATTWRGVPRGGRNRIEAGRHSPTNTPNFRRGYLGDGKGSKPGPRNSCGKRDSFTTTKSSVCPPNPNVPGYLGALCLRVILVVCLCLRLLEVPRLGISAHTKVQSVLYERQPVFRFRGTRACTIL